jgi:hypothetical protein
MELLNPYEQDRLPVLLGGLHLGRRVTRTAWAARPAGRAGVVRSGLLRRGRRRRGGHHRQHSSSLPLPRSRSCCTAEFVGRSVARQCDSASRTDGTIYCKPINKN